MELPSKQLTIGVSNTATPRSDEPELSKQELTRVQSTKKYLELHNTNNDDDEQDTALLTRKRKNQAKRAGTTPPGKKAKQDAVAEEVAALDELIEANPNFMAETFDEFMIENETQLTEQVNESKSLSGADLKPTEKGDDKSVTVTAITAMDIMKAAKQKAKPAKQEKPTLQDVISWGGAHSSYATLFTLAELRYPAFMKSKEGPEYLNKLHEDAKEQAGEQTVSRIFSELQAQESVITQAKQVVAKPAEQDAKPPAEKEENVPELCKGLMAPDEYEEKDIAMTPLLNKLNEKVRARKRDLKKLFKKQEYDDATYEERKKMREEAAGPEPDNSDVLKRMVELRTAMNAINKVCKTSLQTYPLWFGEKSLYKQCNARMKCVSSKDYRRRWNTLAKLSTEEGKQAYKQEEEKQKALIAERNARLEERNASLEERIKQRKDGLGFLARNAGSIEVIHI